MVKIAMMVAAGFFGMEAYEAKAQEFHEIKGPKAKNYKPWKEKARNGILTVDLSKPDIKGPAYKQLKSWEKTSEKVTVNMDLQPISRPKGPKAKNQKPWDKN
ncbi:hypothetical protein IFO69_05985 [Echinicola sp. CAU 1574]|uniref:Uncharacterized protein n=1 Tax=Echinicola arenosa TaxID=2774144 RepID=A0ABR9AHU1_9BACT|nr:hypothetical protein [Echinicola arenosa]MBD8488290.1 hypothetical protein [Echinicola arenosa]